MSDFKFEVMYMPMNSGTFYNDMFGEVLTALLAFSFFAAASISTRTLKTMEEPDEERI